MRKKKCTPRTRGRRRSSRFLISDSETGGSTGVYYGDNYPNVVIGVELKGTAPLAINPVAGFENEEPSLAQTSLAMCLRSAARHITSPLKHYVPSKEKLTDFLVFVQVVSCALSFGKWASGVITNPATGRSITAQVVKNWKIAAQIVVAHMPGVNEERIIELIRVAGLKIGLGVQRPQYSGNCGTFTPGDVQVVSGEWPGCTEEKDKVLAAQIRKLVVEIKRKTRGTIGEEDGDGDGDGDGGDGGDDVMGEI